MTDSKNCILPDKCDVAIIGGGPTGLAAAAELKKLGVESVIVIERETEAGGIPRHCGHSPFGMREFWRIYSGEFYARKLTRTARDAGAVIYLNTTVTSIKKGGRVQLSNQNGLSELQAKKIILCTGTRETPRGGRLVSGQRPLGVLTTGALQSMIYLSHKKPFNRPIIIGTELVSFSALLSCRQSGARPVAMIESNARISARWGLQILAAVLGVPIYYRTQIKNIIGKHRVTSVEIISSDGKTKSLDCDGIVFTGKFVAESGLLRMSHLQLDPVGNPIIDQCGRCSDPDFYATGNMTHPVETAGYCWRDGIQTARFVYASLNQASRNNDEHRLPITLSNSLIKYITPQVLAVPKDNNSQGHNAGTGQARIQLRFTHAVKGKLLLKSGNIILAQKKITALPERRIELTLANLSKIDSDQPLQLQFENQ